MAIEGTEATEDSSVRTNPAYRTKIIEVALPLEAINTAAREEKAVPRHGHPQTLHFWWARRPLAAARGVIFAQMVDDPSAHPDVFPTDDAQEAERQRLFHIIEELVQWKNTTNETVLQKARAEIEKSWRRTCTENADHPRAKELFDPETLPIFHDPFAGGGTLPLEAQRLGLEAYASDLNPVAVLICKAMIEIPPKFAHRPPVNPASGKKSLFAQDWRGAQGLAEDVRYYGQWMRDEAEKRIGHLYPKVEVTADMAQDRPDLRPYVGKKLTPIACLWARTVKSPNPAFGQIDVPLATTFMLSSKVGREVYVEPVLTGDGYRFTVKIGKTSDSEKARNGTKLARANFRCLMSGVPMPGSYIMAEAKAGRIGARMMAMVAEGENGRIYLPPTPEVENLVRTTAPEWRPDVEFFQQALGFRIGNYGMTKWSDLFMGRQLAALTTFSDLIEEARVQVEHDARESGLPADKRGLDSGGGGPKAYAEAVSVYLGCALSRLATYNNSFSMWNMKGGSVAQIFGRQAISMSWDFIEINPLEKMSGNWLGGIGWVSDVLQELPSSIEGHASQLDAASTIGHPVAAICSTDPPYFDNIGYADLSDFFYVWLRRSLRRIYPGLFATITVPKSEELVATPARHGGSQAAERFFLEGMTRAMNCVAKETHPAFPITIYYAFKQSEVESDGLAASTGWETFLAAVLRAGFAISGTWPMRTERDSRLRGQSANALASSIVLVCRPRPEDAPLATRREFISALRAELPPALVALQHGNIAPVDLAQASIGPGMAVFSRYSQVLEADGSPMPVRSALQIINAELDRYLAEQEGEMDPDTRFCIAWYEQYGFRAARYGEAEVLAKAKNTSIDGLVRAGVLRAGGGEVRILDREELDPEWNPHTDTRLTEWECSQYLIRTLRRDGEAGAARLAVTLGGDRAQRARDLAYRLYAICDRKGRAEEAGAYNELVVSWPSIVELAARQPAAQGALI